MSCEDIHNKNLQSHDIIGLLMVPAECIVEMNYSGSSCEDIYNNNPETGDKSGYYCINDNQWTYCNMTAITANFISTCAGVKGGWRRIAYIDISAGDDCPGEWRKPTQSDVSFCRVASNDSQLTCSSANFSTNGRSYQRVCGRTRGYHKGDTVAFYGSQPPYSKTIDQSYVSGLSITYSSNPRQHIWTYASGRGERYDNPWNCLCSINGGYSPSSFVGTIIVNQVPYTSRIMIHIFCVDHCCDDTTQPWFYRQLNEITQDDIEGRICSHGSFMYRSTLIDQLGVV